MATSISASATTATGSTKIPTMMTEMERLTPKLVSALPNLQLEIAVHCVEEESRLDDARIAASLAVYDGILQGLNGVTSANVWKLIGPIYTPRPLTPDLEDLKQAVVNAINALERVNELRIPSMVSEANAIKLINQSNDLTDEVKNIARWFLATSPRTCTGDIIFAKDSQWDATGLDQLERNVWDARGKVLMKLL